MMALDTEAPRASGQVQKLKVTTVALVHEDALKLPANHCAYLGQSFIIFYVYT